MRKGFILIILFGLFYLSVCAQTIKLSDESVLKIENQAKELSNQWDGDSFRHSIVLYSTAAENWRELHKIKNSTNCLLEISRLYSLLGDYKSSMQNLFNALNFLKTIKYNIEIAKVKSLISIAFLRIGKSKESKKFLEESLTISQTTIDPTSQAMSFFSAAEFYYAQNEYKKALVFYQKSLDMWMQTSNRRFQGETLINYGYVYMSMGDPIKGLGLVKNAEKIFQEIDDKRGLAISRIAIGHLLTVMNENQAALDSYFKAINSFPDDIDLVEKARLYNGIGSVYEDYGEWRLSLDNREKAFGLFKTKNYAYGQLATLPSLVKLNFLLNNPDSAKSYFFETKKLSMQLNNDFFLAITLLHMGDYSFENSRNEEAIKYYQKSLITFNKIRFFYWSALSFNKLGNCYFNNGSLEKSNEYYKSSLEISHRISSKFNESETLFNLAKLEVSKLNNGEALGNFKQSIQITENLSSNITNSKIKTTYLSTVFDRYELFINLLMKMQRQSPNKNYAVQALQAAEKSRARSMLETLQLSEASFTKDADPELVKREKETLTLLNLKADKLTDLLSGDGNKTEIDKVETEINELNNQLEDIKGTLKQNSPLYSSIKNPAPFEVNEFQNKILDDKTLLLEFSFGKDESYLWCVGKDEVSSFTLLAREMLETRIQKLRELLSNRAMKSDESVEDYQARIKQSEIEYWQQAQSLSNELLGQTAEKLEGKRLIIVADGKLNYFPIAALPFPNLKNNEPMLLTNEIIYEPSASTLNLILSSSIPKIQPNKSLLVFADPVFSKNDNRLANIAEVKTESKPDSNSAPALRFAESLSNLQRLFASNEEAESITEIVGGSKSNILSGFSASRERVFAPETSDYKILHFATHGSINEQRPELSSIVLSQFNEQGKNQNGLIRLQDIYSLNLSSDLVVLSACETGIGKEVRGEGLMSLNNAFLQVGAKSVVSSLWKVDDNATKELMKNFYQEMASGKFTTSEALRQAQIKMWNNPQFRSPFYWAAFTVQGNYKNSPNLSNSSDYRICFLFLIPISLFGIYTIYRFNLRRKSK